MVFPALMAPTDWFPKESIETDSDAGIIPEPLIETIWGEFEASSLTVRVPARAPITVGVNVTEIVQVSFAATVAGNRGQFVLSAKSPVVAIPEIVKGVLLLFCTVTTLAALTLLTDWLPNESDVGDKEAGTIPVPVSGTVWGEFAALSLIVSTPAREPRAVGVKVIETLQLSFAAKVLGEKGQFEDAAKSPEAVIAEMLSGEVWVFLKTTVLVPLVESMADDPKGTLVGLRV